MISIFGNGLLITAIILNGLNFFTNKKPSSLKFFYLNGFLIVISYLLLIAGFVQADFSIKNVFLNSASLTPLVFKISASWSSHEGSMLLWTMLLYVFNCTGLARTPALRQSSYILIASFIQILFTLYIYFMSNPFWSSSFVPSDGLGLNPMLQDIALSIHPPALYMGNLALSVCFILACTNFIHDFEENQANKVIKDFAIISLIFLSLGIGLGSWWAYRELGWGGFWFFDPIENISLLPWFGTVTLLHSFSLKNIYLRQKFINWFSIISFLSVIYGTCLVRSGIVDSIHSFVASSDRAITLGIIFILIIALLLLIVIKYPKNDRHQLSSYKTYDKLFIISNSLWLICLILITISVLFPIIFSHLLKKDFSLSTDFFLNNFIPLILLNALLLSFMQIANLKRSKTILFIILFFVILMVGLYLDQFSYISIFALSTGILVTLTSINVVIQKTWFNSSSAHYDTVAANLCHGGFGVLILAIVLNCSLRQEMEFSGKVTDKVSYPNFTVSLANVKYADGVNYYRQIAEFWITDNYGFVTIIAPENRFYKNEKILSQESDLYSYLFYDIYGVLSKIDYDTINAKIYYQPFISFIWLGILLIINGLIIQFFKNSKKL